MQCGSCNASLMKLESQRDVLGTYRISIYRCDRCKRTEKELKALASLDTRLTLASNLPAKPSTIR
jgi:hypothetical protein